MLDSTDDRPMQQERVTLTAVDGITKLRAQVRSGAVVNMALLADQVGLTLPDSPRQKTDTEKSIYWLSPNDWLLLNPATGADALGVALREASDNATCAVTDTSAAWSVIELSGAEAAAKLAQGCALDFHDDAFPPGRYALTRLQRLAVIIHRLDTATRFRILVDRSVVQFLRDWITV